MKKSFNGESTVFQDLTQMIDGYQVESNLYILNSNDDERMYKVCLGTGTAFWAVFIVNANHEQDAVDKLIDFCEDNELVHFIYTYLGIEWLCNEGESVEEYVEAHNLVCGGNRGLYIELLHIEEI